MRETGWRKHRKHRKIETLLFGDGKAQLCKVSRITSFSQFCTISLNIIQQLGQTLSKQITHRQPAPTAVSLCTLALMIWFLGDIYIPCLNQELNAYKYPDKLRSLLISWNIRTILNMTLDHMVTTQFSCSFIFESHHGTDRVSECEKQLPRCYSG